MAGVIIHPADFRMGLGAAGGFTGVSVTGGLDRHERKIADVNIKIKIENCVDIVKNYILWKKACQFLTLRYYRLFNTCILWDILLLRNDMKLYHC